MQALQANRRRITHLVFLGDFGNWESLSHWSSLRAEQAFVEEDVALVNARLDEVEAITKRAGIQVVFLEGNHEAWAAQLEAKHPSLRDTVNVPRRLRFRQRGWTWVPENHFWAIGDIHFTHGHLRGNRKAGDLCRQYGVSVIQGHDHTLQTASVRHLDRELEQWSMGCLASIDPPPPYARGAIPSRWVHAFGNVQVRANGRFQISPRKILDESWTELEDGTELRVDPKAVERRWKADQRLRARLRRQYGERFYQVGGAVKRTEPHHGATEHAARTRRARIVRTLPTSR
jgi:hypothetical protein